MKTTLLSIFLFIFTVSVFGQARENSLTGGSKNITLIPNNQKPLLARAPVLLWDNGSLANSPGTGAGGADESVLQSATLSMNTLGFGFQISVGYIMADDFVLSSEQDIYQILVYGYQTGTSTTSTMNTVYLQIWDGQPGSGGSVVWGDMATNRMVSTEWTGIYRVSETTSGATNRPIMKCTCDVNTTLPAGTYWLSVSMGGSSSYSGPWCPSITITGQTTTGNAIQNTGSWASALDSGSSTQQGMPFIVLGPPPVPFKTYYLFIVFVMLGIGVVVKKRFF